MINIDNYLDLIQTEFVMAPMAAYMVYKYISDEKQHGAIMSKLRVDSKKQCKDLRGDEKKLCLLEYQIKALENFKEELSKFDVNCKNDRYPLKCKKKLQDRIRKIDKEISQLTIKKIPLERKVKNAQMRYYRKKK